LRGRFLFPQYCHSEKPVSFFGDEESFFLCNNLKNPLSEIVTFSNKRPLTQKGSAFNKAKRFINQLLVQTS